MKALENISINEKAEFKDGSKARRIFCNGWESASIVLSSVSLMVKNPLLKFALNLASKIGDSVEKKLCKAEE